MDLLVQAIDLMLHLDRYLTEITAEYGTWTYLVLFLIVFCETGLVVTPFLPGDSLLFAAGALAGLGSLDLGILMPLLITAAILGDTLNYSIGKWIGARAFSQNYRFLNPKHLERTQAFYERHGGKTIVLARFVPIVRTFAPFVAGIGTMNYLRFLAYNVVGAVLWVGLFCVAGYFFGNLPLVKNNFSLVILAIIVISVLPIVWEWFQARRSAPPLANASEAGK